MLISLMTNDVGYLFMCLFATYISYLVKYLFKCLTHFFFFKIGLLVFLLLTHPEFFICSAYKLFIKYMICKNICYFLPACSLSFHSPPGIFQSAEIFNLDKVRFTNVFFYGSCFLYHT